MNSAGSEPALIGVDWGTSSLRAFLIGADGVVLDSLSSAEGIMQVKDRNFEGVFGRLVGPWLNKAKLPVLASGMITSRNGWVETPYQQVPLDAATLARALVPHRTGCGIALNFITGAATRHPSGPDVMRGEETQIIGASALGLAQGDFVMPGTHSKWIKVAEGRVEDYATYMTGEVFAVLKSHTILGTLMTEAPFSAAGFERGLAAGMEEGANLLHCLFHVRTLPLMGELPADQAADFLSGLLIGQEVVQATKSRRSVDPVTIVGRNDLTARYEHALRFAGLESRRAPENIVAKGHFLIAQAAGLIQ